MSGCRKPPSAQVSFAFTDCRKFDCRGFKAIVDVDVENLTAEDLKPFLSLVQKLVQLKP